ncbi:MAG: hypothetical protein ACOYW3_13770 [Bacteroidota bacterium]
MDVLERSLALIDKYLADTTVEERHLDWLAVKDLGINGPGLVAYFDLLQTQFYSYEVSFQNSYSGGDEIRNTSIYNDLIENIAMDGCAISMVLKSKITFQTELIVGENYYYGLAA